MTGGKIFVLIYMTAMNASYFAYSFSSACAKIRGVGIAQFYAVLGIMVEYFVFVGMQ